jgi:hypothetical protein
MYARAYPSHPHTACTVLHTRKQCVSYSPHGEPAELQGYPVNATKSPVNAAIRTAWYVQYGVASRMAVRGPNSKLAQKLNITLQERSWRLVGVKVGGNPLTVLWKYMPVRNTHGELRVIEEHGFNVRSHLPHILTAQP